MRELGLFTGAGGGLLASRLLGWTPVCAVELREFARKSLFRRQREGHLERFPIWDDINTFDGRGWRGVDVVSGGFPCQDISAAGKGRGLAGARSGLWFQMLRIVDEARPRFVWAENSPLLRTRGLGTILQGLARLGYDARWCVLGARHIGANHNRDRLWLLASRTWRPVVFACECDGFGNCPVCGIDYAECPCPGPTQDGFEYTADGLYARPLADGVGEGLEGHSGNGPHLHQQGREPAQADRPVGPSGLCCRRHASRWWHAEPGLDRVVDGVADRVEPTVSIGNGQVPAVAATAFRILSAGLT